MADTVTPLQKGDYIYTRDGFTAFFYEDKECTKQVGPSGGKRGQTNPPNRIAGQVVGAYTGNFFQQGNELISLEVDWTNEYYKDPKTFQLASFLNPIAGALSIGSVIVGGTRVKEDRTSWVKASLVRWTDVYTDPEQRGGADGGLSDIPASTGGDTTTTLLYVAIAVALFWKFRDKIFKRR